MPLQFLFYVSHRFKDSAILVSLIHTLLILENCILNNYLLFLANNLLIQAGLFGSYSVLIPFEIWNE